MCDILAGWADERDNPLVLKIWLDLLDFELADIKIAGIGWAAAATLITSYATLVIACIGTATDVATPRTLIATATEVATTAGTAAATAATCILSRNPRRRATYQQPSQKQNPTIFDNSLWGSHDTCVD